MANFTGAIFDESTTWEGGVAPEGTVESSTVTTGYLNMTGATLDGSTFNNLTLDGVIFDGASLDGATMTDVDFKNVDFGDVDVSTLKMDDKTTMKNVSFDNPVPGGAPIVITETDTSKIVKTFYEELDVNLDDLIDVFGASINVSDALGDPYIYPMRSATPVKLLDMEACYRLYQCDNTFINAEVSIATKEHRNRMTKFVEKLGNDTKNVITDGYFFSKFFIADGKNKIVVDLREKNILLLEGSDKNFFHISQNNNHAGNKQWNGKAKNVVIEWITEKGNMIKSTVSFFENPHIENGISLSVSNLPKKALGLCVSNYRPKLMRVPSLTTEKHGKIARQVKKSRNPFQKIAIKSNREGWVAKK